MRVYEVIDKLREIFFSNVPKSNLTLVEKKIKAEEYCFKVSQLNSFQDEISALENSRSISKSSRILNLNPKMIDGLLRAEGRLSLFSVDNFSFKPIILDAKEDFTRLLIKEYHEKFFHGSHETVINEMRQKFWIVGLRQVLCSIVSKCLMCKIRRAKPAQPKMADLPLARLLYRLQPFTHRGLDYFADGSKNWQMTRKTIGCFIYMYIHLCNTYRASVQLKYRFCHISVKTVHFTKKKARNYIL